MAQKRHMTYREAVKEFNQEIKPRIIRKYPRDKPALRTAWNDYVDHLEKSGQISVKQSYTWGSPVK